MVVPTFEVTTRQRVKDWLGETGKGDSPDETIDRLLPVLTELLEARLHNKIDRVVGRLVYPRPNRKGFTRYLYLPFNNVVDDATFKVETAEDRDFATSPTLIERENYHLSADGGFVELDTPLRFTKPGQVRITATGGIADKFQWVTGDAADLDYLVASSAAGAPANALRGVAESISHAATIILGETFKRRRNLGRSSTRDRTGTTEYVGELALPKIALTMLEPFVRRSIRG